jgi:hypothetical protein
VRLRKTRKGKRRGAEQQQQQQQQQQQDEARSEVLYSGRMRVVSVKTSLIEQSCAGAGGRSAGGVTTSNGDET